MSSGGGGGEGGGVVNSDRDYVKQILCPSSECFHFFLLCPSGVEPMDNYFFSRFDRSLFTHTKCHSPSMTFIY